jgi:hypothetical protein
MGSARESHKSPKIIACGTSMKRMLNIGWRCSYMIAYPLITHLTKIKKQLDSFPCLQKDFRLDKAE